MVKIKSKFNGIMQLVNSFHEMANPLFCMENKEIIMDVSLED